ncbi:MULTISPECIES: type II secretion system F family protein [Micromonospora]|uniref:Tight adherence protein B n=1 Tax=Micromonospora solifontis TaxID=2487138 RepID=A0ABX9WMP3_9ACTN|nr:MULTISPECIES: hypothetical protein [Micromonospora]NES13253.1 hypothetical protein [Micromonospora sp. PPF5-17B]NES34622.1 hypothetical protein [Micromonospora solifontis]NES57014.1 hypothetical protein [Micromonospora sp. PPF5-6]RNM01868.1 hypothetical protein EFE23_00355 [Micromonospora solifontis]
MTGPAWLAAVLLLGVGVVVAWPARPVRSRRRALLGTGSRTGAVPAGTPLRRRVGVPRGRRGDRSTPDRSWPAGPPNRRDAARPFTDLPPGRSRVGAPDRSIAGRGAALGGQPARHALPAAALLGGGVGLVLGGPVGAVVLAAYGGLGARAVRRRHARRSAEQARRRELDRLCALAADLRAGLPVTLALADGPERVARLARAAVRLADRTGAPLAELLERVEADARATDRGLAAAAAQAAGARATAWLLAALPLGGIGLGYAIGVDPVTVLLRTPVGGGSALAAVTLQIGGLLWAERLGATPGRAA